jgi:prevent-host-death family protein
MVDLSRDIIPLTDFKRRTSEYLERLKETGGPLVLTVNGKPEVVLLDPAEYQKIVKLLDPAEKVR